jgi:hypothetical protein
MAEQKIMCGDVDGEGTECVFLRGGWRTIFECIIARRGMNNKECKCICNAARLVALAKQDGELVGLVREIAKFGSIAYDDEEKECPFCGERAVWGGIIKHEPYCLRARARAALAERGVEV